MYYAYGFVYIIFTPLAIEFLSEMCISNIVCQINIWQKPGGFTLQNGITFEIFVKIRTVAMCPIHTMFYC